MEKREIKRNLDGVYFRVKRNKNYENICFSDLSVIEREAFASSSIEKVSIPSTVTKIGIMAFYGCSSLVDLSIPESVTYIGKYSFFDCQ